MGIDLRWSAFGMGGGGPPKKELYQEATVNGRRGRVLKEYRDLFLVEFYATGEKEIVLRNEASFSVRKP